MRYGKSPADNPIARTPDPASSHEAAANITDSGRRETLVEKVTRLVKAFPNSTYVELWHFARYNHSQNVKPDDFTSPESLMKRLNDARAKGWIESGEQRLCPVTGNKQLTWHVKK